MNSSGRSTGHKGGLSGQEELDTAAKSRREQDEALNKGLSRALKEDNVGFVQLFLDYGADTERYNLAYQVKAATQSGKPRKNQVCSLVFQLHWGHVSVHEQYICF